MKVSMWGILQYDAIVLLLKNDAYQCNDVWMTKVDVYCYFTFQLMCHSATNCHSATVNSIELH